MNHSIYRTITSYHFVMRPPTKEDIARQRVLKKKEFHDKLNRQISSIAILFILGVFVTKWCWVALAFVIIDLAKRYREAYGTPWQPGWEEAEYQRELEQLERAKNNAPAMDLNSKPTQQPDEIVPDTLEDMDAPKKRRFF
jgi:hypothetical protein